MIDTTVWPESPTAPPLGLGRLAAGLERPESVDTLRQAVARRVTERLAIYPQGGATALDYGGIPRSPGVVIDTRSLDRVIDYPAADMTVTVEAGMTLAALQTLLEAEGQRLLVDAPRPDRATIGGIYATNTSGPRRFGAGRPRDQIIGISFVTSDGEIVKGGGRVVKNVAGYDFPKLLTGSMGTLGVIAQLTLKVRPRPDASAFVWMTFANADEVTLALERLNTSDTRPIAIELLNRPAATAIGGPIGLPIDAYAIAVGFEDNVLSVAWQVEHVRKELAQLGCAIVEDRSVPPLWSALVEFQATGFGPVTIVANLRPATVSRFVGGLDAALWSAQAHAGSGIVRAHWLGGSGLELVAPEVDRLRALAVADGGNLVLSRCPAGAVDRLRVWGEPRADWALAERIKRALDPSGLMNPGRFVGNI